MKRTFHKDVIRNLVNLEELSRSSCSQEAPQEAVPMGWLPGLPVSG